MQHVSCRKYMPALLINSYLSSMYVLTLLLDSTRVWCGHALLDLFCWTLIDFCHWLKMCFFSLSSSSPIHSIRLIFFLCFFTLCKHSLSRVVWKCQRHHGRWVGHTYFILSDTCSILCQPPRLCLVPARKRHEKLTMCTLLKYHVQSQRSDKWNPKIDSVALWLCDLFGVFFIVVLFVM